MTRFERVRLRDGLGTVHDDAAATVARRLLAAGFVTVAWVGLEAQGAAVIDAFGDAPTVLDEAACAAWAVKALGGWNTLLADIASSREGAHVSMVLADLDWTMDYNDAHGHQAGDLMIARVHACIES